MKRIRKILITTISVFLLAIILSIVIPSVMHKKLTVNFLGKETIFQAGERTVVATGKDTSGTCTWTIYSDGELNIKPTSGDTGTLSIPAATTEQVEQDSMINYKMSPWYSKRDKIKKVTFSKTINSDTKCRGLFYDSPNLEEIDFTNFNTTNATSMQNMFAECKNLKTIKFSNTFKTDNIKSLAYMFRNCESLTTLDLSGFNTSNIESLYGTFINCKSLASIKFGKNFDTSKVTTMRSTFYGCEALTDIDLSNFNTSKVTSIRTMFQNCKSLNKLDLSKFDTSSVEDMTNMLAGIKCSYVDLRNFETSDATYVGAFFQTSDIKKISFNEKFNFRLNDPTVKMGNFGRGMWLRESDNKEYSAEEICQKLSLTEEERKEATGTYTKVKNISTDMITKANNITSKLGNSKKIFKIGPFTELDITEDSDSIFKTEDNNRVVANLVMDQLESYEIPGDEESAGKYKIPGKVGIVFKDGAVDLDGNKYDFKMTLEDSYVYDFAPQEGKDSILFNILSITQNR